MPAARPRLGEAEGEERNALHTFGSVQSLTPEIGMCHPAGSYFCMGG